MHRALPGDSQAPGRQMAVQRCHIGGGRLALVSGLGGDLGAVRGDEHRAGKRANAVANADLRAGLPFLERNPCLGKVDHQQHDPTLGPLAEGIGFKHVSLERPAVLAPVAPGKDGQHGPAGLLGDGEGLGIVGSPAVFGMGDGDEGRENQGQASCGSEPPSRNLKPSHSSRHTHRCLPPGRPVPLLSSGGNDPPHEGSWAKTRGKG